MALDDFAGEVLDGRRRHGADVGLPHPVTGPVTLHPLHQGLGMPL